MSDKLKPCPFCGADAEIRAHPLALHDEESRGWEVACWKCGARVGSTVLPTGKTKEQAIEAWNRRASTLGRGTCHAVFEVDAMSDDERVGEFVCSECGETFNDGHGEFPRYCPNCGKKVEL